MSGLVFQPWPKTPRLFRDIFITEKIDGTNVGIHFATDGKMALQCRGHLITEGMHPQYDLFKQWAAVKHDALHAVLGERFILFGEWLYAKHSVHYRALPHYFFEFDIYDKVDEVFLSLDRRLGMLDGTGVQTVPVVHTGAATRDELLALVGPSAFDSTFDNPLTGRPDDLMEGLYLRTERDGVVTGRAKIVRPEFVERVKLSEHWQHTAMVPNTLRPDASIWS